jgi:hypothetical protein
MIPSSPTKALFGRGRISLADNAVDVASWGRPSQPDVVLCRSNSNLLHTAWNGRSRLGACGQRGVAPGAVR